MDKIPEPYRQCHARCCADQIGITFDHGGLQDSLERNASDVLSSMQRGGSGPRHGCVVRWSHR